MSLPLAAAKSAESYDDHVVRLFLMAAIWGVSGMLVALTATRAARRFAGSVLVVSAIATLLGPWFADSLPGVHGWLHL